jgi:SAM-dependent methyltransferase
MPDDERGRESAQSATKMRVAWDRFARDDPMYYIHCGRKDWDRDAFFDTGRADVAEWMEWLGDDVARGRMLEFGCGIGRMSVFLAEEFDHVDAVDVSSAMIDQARSLDPPASVRFETISGDGLDRLDDDAYDFVGSRAVFQHIPDEDAIAGYLRDVARVLKKPEGGALLQFNTAPSSLLRRSAYLLPDPLLPRTSRRYMRCYRRDPDRIRELVAAAGLVVAWERSPGTTFHYLFLQKPGSSGRP